MTHGSLCLPFLTMERDGTRLWRQTSLGSSPSITTYPPTLRKTINSSELQLPCLSFGNQAVDCEVLLCQLSVKMHTKCLAMGLTPSRGSQHISGLVLAGINLQPPGYKWLLPILLGTLKMVTFPCLFSTYPQVLQMINDASGLHPNQTVQHH